MDAAPDNPPPIAQYAGKSHNCEFLLSIYATDSNGGTTAVLETRADAWDTFDAPVQLAAVPVSAWSGGAA